MLDHIGLTVSDPKKSKAFYQKVLAPLGYGVIKEHGTSVGFGKDGRAYFWIGEGEVIQHSHVAFVAEERQMVHSFYETALAAGATDNGAPGPRPHYHPNYYGAFVLDPDGHNIEAVCRKEA